MLLVIELPSEKLEDENVYFLLNIFVLILCKYLKSRGIYFETMYERVVYIAYYGY